MGGGGNTRNAKVESLKNFMLDGLIWDKVTLDTGVVMIYNEYEAYVIISNKPVSSDKSGWKVIATIPEGFRPPVGIRFCGFDNSETAQKTNTAIDMEINTYGQIRVYLFHDKLEMDATGYASYPIIQ